MGASRDDERTAATRPGARERLGLIAKIVIVDVAAPLATYNLLRSAGMTTVTALVLSGVVPAIGVAAGIIRHHRLDIVGALVLGGIVVGTVLGLLTHSPRLVLMEGSVPTAVLGVACLGSLCTRRPLMFSFAMEFTGPDTPNGREMTKLWQYAEFGTYFGSSPPYGDWFPPRGRPAGRHRLWHLHRNRLGELEGHAVRLGGRVVGMDGRIRRAPEEEG